MDWAIWQNWLPSGAGRLVRIHSFNPLAPRTDAIAVARTFVASIAEGTAP
jgi:hypothetical protein